jgi:RNA polymerase sigma factor (sigma-70 family)
MSASNAPRDAGRLDALRSNASGRFEPAYESLRRELVGYARSIAGGRSDRADFQPESIVASVLARNMQEAVGQCRDDGHLDGWLRQAVRHELLDRVDKRRPESMPAQEGDDRAPAFDPADTQDGPSTILMARDALAEDRQALARFFGQLQVAALTESDRTLLDLYVVERLEWEVIAERVGTTVGAARVAMKRLRDRLLPRIFEPIRKRLTDEEWRVAEAMFVARLPAERAKEALGLDADRIRTIAVNRVVPAILEEWGGQSAEMVLRLTGHRR